MRTVILVLACAIGASGCNRDATPAGAISTTDSAGVQIVSVTAPEPDTAAVEKVLDIGSVEGDPEYQLHQVNVMARLADGTLVVANNRTELRYYSADGEYLRTVGREGEGPGEFRSISYMRRLRSDSLLVYDARNRRVTILAPDGASARDFTPPSSADGLPLQVAAALEDGTPLLRQRASVPEQSQQLRRDTLTFLVPDSSGTRQLDAYAGAEMQLVIAGMGTDAMSISIAQLPFSRDAYAAASADAFFVTSNETYDIHQYDPSGVLRRVLRRTDMSPRAVDDALVAQYIDARIAEIVARGPERPGAPPPDPASIRRHMESLPRVPFAPVHGGILVADDGTLWVKHYTQSELEPARWDVYGADGSLQLSVALPARFTPELVHDDTVYGVQLDELDVEHVVAYRVH